MRKSLLTCVFFAIGITGYVLFWGALWKLSDGFKPSFISSSLLPSVRRNTDPLNEKIRSILSQDYFYIGKGSQCFIFESEDRQHVLKFFRYPRYRFWKLSDYFSLPQFLTDIETRKADKKRQKLDDLFESCLLAYRELREESGLEYMHLNKTSDLNIRLTCYDKLKRPFVLHMDQYEFFIQKKAELVYPYLSKLLKHGQREEAKKALYDLTALLHSRFQKGIFDHDSFILKNTGFRFGSAMFMDVGQFKKDARCQDPFIVKIEMKRMTRPLYVWLMEKDLEIAKDFEQSLFKNSIEPETAHR